MKNRVRTLAKALLRRWGYDLRRIESGPPLETFLEKTGRDAAYYTKYATRWPIFSPWVGHPEFQQLFEGIASLSAGSPERGYVLMRLAQYARHLPGDFAEYGVYRGGSALLICRVLQETNKRFYLFDSFQGLPPLDPRHDTNVRFREEQFATPVEGGPDALE
jgi:hypothetical protein